VMAKDMQIFENAVWAIVEEGVSRGKAFGVDAVAVEAVFLDFFHCKFGGNC